MPSTDAGRRWGLHRTQPWGPLDDFDRASLAVDACIFTVHDGQLRVLVHRRAEEPHRGTLALPGVFANYGERFEDAVFRALKDKASLSYAGPVEQVVAWNHPERGEPRGWVVTVVYLGLAPWRELQAAIDLQGEDVRLVSVRAGQDSDGEPVELLSEAGLPLTVAFDHAQLIGLALRRLQAELWVSRWPLVLLPERFTLRQAQDVYEAISGEVASRTSFRRRIVDVHQLIRPTGVYVENVPRRAPEYYEPADTPLDVKDR